MRPQFRPLANHHRVQMIDAQAAFVEQSPRVFEKNQARRALPLRIGVRKMRADIPKPRRRPAARRKARGTARRHRNGPPSLCQTELRCRRSSAFALRPGGADRSRFRSASSGESSRALRSCSQIKSREIHVGGRVIFKLRSEPSTTNTSWPNRSTSAASSDAVTPSFCALRNASRSSAYVNACGVCASTMRSRGIVAVINATSSGRLRALHFLHRIDRRNAENRRAAFARFGDHAIDLLGSHERPHRVVDQHDFRSSGPPARAHSPPTAAACRRRAPRAPGVPAPPCATLSCSETISSARVAMKKSVIAGHAASRRSVKMISGTPSSSRNCFGVSAPMRVPSPAAGMIAAIRLIEWHSLEICAHGVAFNTRRRSSVEHWPRAFRANENCIDGQEWPDSG